MHRLLTSTEYFSTQCTPHIPATFDFKWKEWSDGMVSKRSHQNHWLTLIGGLRVLIITLFSRMKNERWDSADFEKHRKIKCACIIALGRGGGCWRDHVSFWETGGTLFVRISSNLSRVHFCSLDSVSKVWKVWSSLKISALKVGSYSCTVIKMYIRMPQVAICSQPIVGVVGLITKRCWGSDTVKERLRPKPHTNALKRR